MAKPDILEQTLAGLELGLRVRHIATYFPSSCDVNDSAADVTARPENATFDAIPVKDGNRTVGLLERIWVIPRNGAQQHYATRRLHVGFGRRASRGIH